MATKKKPDELMKLVKAVKATISTNSVLPILEDVYLTGETAEFTDLETHVIVPFKTNIKHGACVPARLLMDSLSLMKEPVITELPVEIEGEGENAIKKYSVSLQEGKRKIKIPSDSPMNFPRSPLDIESGFSLLYELSDTLFEKVLIAAKFVSNDGLRPAMTGVYFGNDFCSTDGHRLYRHKLEVPFDESFILPKKAIKILSIFPGPWKIFWAENHVAFLNADNVIILSRTIDARFPDYPVVIPTDQPICQLITHTASLREELKVARKYANHSTEQIVFSINGETTISSQDVDFSFEYSNVLENVEHKGENIQIAFNGKFLDEMLAELPTDRPVIMNLWTPTKCTIIETDYFGKDRDQYLLMPLMPNS